MKRSFFSLFMFALSICASAQAAKAAPIIAGSQLGSWHRVLRMSELSSSNIQLKFDLTSCDYRLLYSYNSSNFPSEPIRRIFSMETSKSSSSLGTTLYFNLDPTDLTPGPDSFQDILDSATRDFVTSLYNSPVEQVISQRLRLDDLGSLGFDISWKNSVLFFLVGLEIQNAPASTESLIGLGFRNVSRFYLEERCYR